MSATETSSSLAFIRISAGERFKKLATLSTGMPRRSVLLRKNKSALSQYEFKCCSLPGLDCIVASPRVLIPAKTSTVHEEYGALVISMGRYAHLFIFGIVVLLAPANDTDCRICCFATCINLKMDCPHPRLPPISIAQFQFGLGSA